MKLVNILKELKQVGILYHWTPVCFLLEILKTNILKGNDVYGYGKNSIVSLTRSKLKPAAPDLNVSCCIVLDGNKLSNKYKISPYANLDTYPMWNEFEEIIKGDIKNIKNYIIKIKIFSKHNDDKKYSEWGAKYNNKECIKNVLSLCKNLNIPIESIEDN